MYHLSYGDIVVFLLETAEKSGAHIGSETEFSIEGWDGSELRYQVLNSKLGLGHE